MGEFQFHSVEVEEVEVLRAQLVHHFVEDWKTSNSSVIFTHLDGHRTVAEADPGLPSGVDQSDADVVELALLLSSQHLHIEAPVHFLNPLAEKEEPVVPGENVQKGFVSVVDISARIS